MSGAGAAGQAGADRVGKTHRIRSEDLPAGKSPEVFSAAAQRAQQAAARQGDCSCVWVSVPARQTE